MNIESMKILLAIFAIKALVLIAFSMAVQATETTLLLRITEAFNSETIKNRDSSLAIPVEVALYKLRQRQKIALVDIRKREDFERLHIAGSMNIPLYAVKTRLFLRSFPVVLINEGFHYRPLEKECRQLADLGFKVSILDGGLPAWKGKGGRLEGDLFALKEMRAVAPQIYFQEKDYENNWIIDISPVQSEVSRKLMSWSKHMPLLANPEQWARKLRRIIENHKNQPFLNILVFNETGGEYGELDEIAAGLGVNTFYLEGGIAGYKRYLESLSLSWRPRNSRIRTDTACETCREEIEAIDLGP